MKITGHGKTTISNKSNDVTASNTIGNKQVLKVIQWQPNKAYFEFLVEFACGRREYISKREYLQLKQG